MFTVSDTSSKTSSTDSNQSILGNSDINNNEHSDYDGNFSQNEDEDIGVIYEDPLYENSPITTKSFSFLIKAYLIKHSISEKATDDILKIFCNVLPDSNNCPTTVYKLNKITNIFKHQSNHFKLCSRCHCELIANVCSNEECDSDARNDSMNFFTFDLENQLQNIIKSKYYFYIIIQ